MTLTAERPAGDETGRALDCLAWRLDASDYKPLPSKYTLRLNRNERALPGKAECIRRLREAMAEGHFDPAGEKFRYVLRLLRRSVRNEWKPTPPQIRNMQRIVADLDEDESLIDWGDTGYG